MSKLKNVLLVDDDETNNFLVKHMLSKIDSCDKIFTALNGEDALQQIVQYHKENIQIDLIFLDINMPVMDGFEFLDEYQKLPSELHSKTTIMMISSSVHPDDLNKVKTYECVDEFIEKPLSVQIIKDVIKRM